MDVKIKDRKEEVEFLRMVCNMAELRIDYIHADLILKLQDRLNKLKGDFSLNNGVQIHHQWKTEWEKYFDDLNHQND